jgi:hypothetical protein
MFAVVVDKLEKLPREKIVEELLLVGLGAEAIEGLLDSLTLKCARSCFLSSPLLDFVAVAIPVLSSPGLTGTHVRVFLLISIP